MRIRLRRAVGGDPDAVVKVRNRIVRDHVSGAVDLDRVVAGHLVGAIRPGARPQRPGPTDQPEPIVPADEQVVRNIKVARAGKLGPHAEPDVLEAAVPDGQRDGTSHAFLTGHDRHVGVADRQPFQNVMLRRHHVEERVAARAVDDDLAVTGGRDRDRPLRCAFERERHRAVERCHLRIDVVQPLGAVQAGMHQDRIARPGAPFPDDAPVAQSRAVIRLQQTGEARLQTGALVVGGVDVERSPRGRSLRFAPRADARDLDRLSRGAIGIPQLEAAFVFGARAQVEDAAGKTVGHDVVQVLTLPEHSLAANPCERQPLPPHGFACGPELDIDRRIAIRVPPDRPFEPEVQKRGMLDDERAGFGRVLGARGGRGKHEDGSDQEDPD